MKTNVSSLDSRRGLRGLRTLGLLAALTVSLHAQVVFTVTGKANGAALGYADQQVATFTFVLQNFAPTTPVGSASAGASYVWTEELLSNPELFPSVSGTGLSGTWTRPNASGGSPYSLLEAHSDGSLKLTASLDTGSTGMTVNGTALQTVAFFADLSGVDFSDIGSSLPDPTSYFSGKLGTFTVADSYSGKVWDITNHSEDFTITSVTISSSAVPEPATWATLAGAAMLALAVWRRGRGRAAGA